MNENFTTLQKRQYFQQLRRRWDANDALQPFYVSEACGCGELTFSEFAVRHVRRSHAKRLERGANHNDKGKVT